MRPNCLRAHKRLQEGCATDCAREGRCAAGPRQQGQSERWGCCIEMSAAAHREPSTRGADSGLSGRPLMVSGFSAFSAVMRERQLSGLLGSLFCLLTLLYLHNHLQTDLECGFDAIPAVIKFQSLRISWLVVTGSLHFAHHSRFSLVSRKASLLY